MKFGTFSERYVSWHQPAVMTRAQRREAVVSKWKYLSVEQENAQCYIRKSGFRRLTDERAALMQPQEELAVPRAVISEKNRNAEGP
jgi:hypothetical protein